MKNNGCHDLIIFDLLFVLVAKPFQKLHEMGGDDSFAPLSKWTSTTLGEPHRGPRNFIHMCRQVVLAAKRLELCGQQLKP